MLVNHPDGKKCNTDGMTEICKNANCVYYQYDYLSKCVVRHAELKNNL